MRQINNNSNDDKMFTYRNNRKAKSNHVQHNIGDSRFSIGMLKGLIIAEETPFVWGAPKVED